MEREWDDCKRRGWEHVRHDKDKKIITICRVLCERLLKDDYNTRFRTRYNTAWEKHWEINKGKSGLVHLNKRMIGKDYFKEHMKAQEQMRQQDKELLFKLLLKHIDKLWV
jgi:hypothetical protein